MEKGVCVVVYLLETNETKGSNKDDWTIQSYDSK